MGVRSWIYFIALILKKQTLRVSNFHSNKGYRSGILSILIIGIVPLLFLCPIVSAAVPVADFSGTPTSGAIPLTVSFTDASSNVPTGWAWFFGDETYTQAWTQVNASAGWSAREYHTSVAMPDGSIVLMGGWDAGAHKNDVWRSTDNGTTWIRVNAGAGWSARIAHTSVAMPDGSIVLMGGEDSGGSYKNDTWRSVDNGATWIRVNASAGWSAREAHTSVAMPDGSIVLMGGGDSGGYKNDVWRSTDNGATWIRVNVSAGWSARASHTSVAMPDGSIVLMGGWDGAYKNDVWRSTDNGATWTQVNASAGWTARRYHTGVVMPDGSIVLMGGEDSGGHKNDVWRFMSAGSLAQNPSHIYTIPGIYPVALQAYNTGGYNSTRKTGYITVTLSDFGSDSGSGNAGGDDGSPSFISTSGKIMTVTVNVGGGSAVTRTDMTGTNLGKNLVITALPRSNLPTGIAPPPTIVYQYMSITTSTIPGVVIQTALDFSVPLSWITEHGFTIGDIVMMRNVDGQWQTLNTQFVSQKDGNVFYRAFTTGLSYFAIAYQKGGTDMTSVTPAMTSVTPAGTSVTGSPSPVPITPEKTQTVPPAPVAFPAEGIPLTTIIIGIIGTIAIVLGAFLVRRWWIRRQNPALFKKYD